MNIHMPHTYKFDSYLLFLEIGTVGLCQLVIFVRTIFLKGFILLCAW